MSLILVSLARAGVNALASGTPGACHAIDRILRHAMNRYQPSSTAVLLYTGVITDLPGASSAALRVLIANLLLLKPPTSRMLSTLPTWSSIFRAVAITLSRLGWKKLVISACDSTNLQETSLGAQSSSWACYSYSHLLLPFLVFSGVC